MNLSKYILRHTFKYKYRDKNEIKREYFQINDTFDHMKLVYTEFNWSDLVGNEFKFTGSSGGCEAYDVLTEDEFKIEMFVNAL